MGPAHLAGVPGAPRPCGVDFAPEGGRFAVGSGQRIGG
jgi:hypothetical protein